MTTFLSQPQLARFDRVSRPDVSPLTVMPRGKNRQIFKMIGKIRDFHWSSLDLTFVNLSSPAVNSTNPR